MAALLIMLGMLALNIYSVFADGYVLAKLWEWHAVPLGMRPLSWTVFGAVVIAIAVIRGVKSSKSDEDKETSEVIAEVVVACLVPWFLLLVGWFLKS